MKKYRGSWFGLCLGLALILGLSIAPTLTVTADAPPIVGDWGGTLDPGAQPKKRILVHISAGPDGTLSGTNRSPKGRADWIWVELLGSCSIPAPVAGFHRLRRPGPSPAELQPAADRVPTVVVGPPERRALLPATSRRLWPFEHSRQPDESWCSIPRAISRWLVVRFF